MLGTKHGSQALSDDIRDDGNGYRFHEYLWNERRTGKGWLRETCWNAADVTDGFDLMDRVEVKRGGDDDTNDNKDQLGWNREPAHSLDLGDTKMLIIRRKAILSTDTARDTILVVPMFFIILIQILTSRPAPMYLSTLTLRICLI